MFQERDAEMNVGPTQTNTFQCQLEIQGGWHSSVAVYLLNLESNNSASQYQDNRWTDTGTKGKYDVDTTLTLPTFAKWILRVKEAKFSEVGGIVGQRFFYLQYLQTSVPGSR